MLYKTLRRRQQRIDESRQREKDGQGDRQQPAGGHGVDSDAETQSSLHLPTHRYIR